MNKYARVNEEVKTTIQFAFTWIGNRIPDCIVFPSGKKSKVQYMREGKIMLENGNFGSYKRVYDNNKTNQRVIQLELEME